MSRLRRMSESRTRRHRNQNRPTPRGVGDGACASVIGSRPAYTEGYLPLPNLLATPWIGHSPGKQLFAFKSGLFRPRD
jgi:hypothetical protein